MILKMEEFLLCQDKEAWLDKLLPETEEYTFFKLNYELKKGKGKLSDQLQKIFTSYRKKDASKRTKHSKSMKLKY